MSRCFAAPSLHTRGAFREECADFVAWRFATRPTEEVSARKEFSALAEVFALGEIIAKDTIAETLGQINMDSLTDARELAAAGRFADALSALTLTSVQGRSQTATEVLRSYLLERVGRLGQSRTLVQHLLTSNRLTGSERSLCEFVLGRMELEDGRADSGLMLLQKSAGTALQARDLERACWAQLRCLDIISSRSGPDAMAPLIDELHANATRLGDPMVIAALHIHVGQAEAKRGLVENARRHTRLALRTLRRAPNCWLESVAENTEMNVAIMRSEFTAALEHGHRAIRLADVSGVASVKRASLGNLGHVLHWLGRFEEAADHCERSLSTLPAAGASIIGAIDNLAQIRLVEGRLEECARLLDRIEESVRQPADRRMYNYRHSQLTRIQLLTRCGRHTEALAAADSLGTLAADTSDRRLQNQVLLAKAALLAETARLPELRALLDDAPEKVAGDLDLLAEYERVLGCGLAAAGRADLGEVHIERARRIYHTIGHVPGLMELSRCWNAAGTTGAPDDERHDEADRSPVGAGASPELDRARIVLQGTVTALLGAGRPELVAGEIVRLLEDTGCVRSAAVIARTPDGRPNVPGERSDRLPTSETVCCLRVGPADDGTVEILMEPEADVECLATLNAVRLLLATIHELERARAEREERLRLWPFEDVAVENGHAVAGGRMRELMAFARRVAPANVGVLITGESGTGKEVLARAIHGFSPRAQKPFIPFNCTAVPRDVLESHLFGHRRGSFTGADRDHPGLIRTARDGTLFLDEIGELGLDLQPKLLRFLESGEISPLGEPPVTVDVRILAATNADLDQLVKAGRFREDLFYRLNVIRLRVPPLRERRDEIPGLVHHFVRQAAEEFQKGQVRVAEETMEQLVLCGWPGNIRQLQNEIRRMVALAERDALLAPADLSADIAAARPAARQPVGGLQITVPLRDKLTAAVSQVEREMIRAALTDHGGKMEEAAKALGISRKGLYLKRQRFGL